MSRAVMTVMVVLATYAALNLVLTAMVSTAWLTWLRRQPLSQSDLLALRLLPSVGGLGLAVTICLPAFLRFEPPHGQEFPGLAVTALASLTVLLVIAGAYRGIAAALATRALTRRWNALGRRQSPAGITMDVVDAPSVVAVCGFWRPRVLIGRDVASQCTAEELALILAHEEAHVRSRDNVKQLLMLISPDLPGALTVHAAVEERWRAATELAADDNATRDDPERRVRLAAALVKMARLALTTAPRPGVASPLIGAGGIERRVRRLLDDAPRLSLPDCYWIAPVLLAIGVLLAVGEHQSIHAALEHLVAVGR
jgi:Zn-dependent protease with chaperone function